MQRPGVPVWVGGESNAALRRTVRLGDTWLPIHTNPRRPLDTATRFRDGARRLHALAEQHGRDAGSIGLAVWSNSYDETLPEQWVDGEHHLLTSRAGALIDDIDTLADIGVAQAC